LLDFNILDKNDDSPADSLNIYNFTKPYKLLAC